VACDYLFIVYTRIYIYEWGSLLQFKRGYESLEGPGVYII